MEIKPKIYVKPSVKVNYNFKYVTLSEFGSHPIKSWKNSWQPIVDFLKSNGYETIVISKEPTNLINIIDKSGDISLSDRMIDINGAEFHMGVSSGLSWLSWALGTHVLMVSDCTVHIITNFKAILLELEII